MTAVVMNSARMVARKRSRSPQHFMEGQNLKEGSVPLAEMLPDRRPGPEEAACQRDLEHRLRRLSAHLPPNLRDVIQLCGIDGHSIREAAEVLGLTITAVKSRSMRARKELRRLDRMNPADRREPGR